MSRGRRAAALSLLGIALLAAGYLALLSYVDARIRERSEAGVYQQSKKIWATRGLVAEGIERNTIASVQNAFARGAPGTEIDVFYDVELGHFVVSHSRSYRARQKELLSLERMFQETGQGGQYFWLDFKKLRLLSAEQVQQAAARLDAITRRGDLRRRVYIEGGDPINLSRLRAAGFQTIFDIYPLREQYPFSWLLIQSYKMAWYFWGFTVISMDHGDPGDLIYGPEIARALADVPVFLYHVPDDPKRLRELIASPSVRVILISQESARFETM